MKHNVTETITYSVIKGAMYLLLGYIICNTVKGVKTINDLPDVF